MLEITNLSLLLSQQDKPLLKNINLRIDAGELVTIVGNNGAGKSSLLKCIAGEYQTTAGMITLQGNNLDKRLMHQIAKQVAFVTQKTSDGLISEMTVSENLKLAGSIVKNCRHETTIELLKSLNLNLETHINHAAHQLSGGQQQALALLMATLRPINTLLLDEHCAALDASASRHIMRLTQQIIKQKSIACLMVTHDLQAAIDYSDRLVIMKQGEIIRKIKQPRKAGVKKQYLMQLIF